MMEQQPRTMTPRRRSGSMAEQCCGAGPRKYATTTIIITKQNKPRKNSRKNGGSWGAVQGNEEKAGAINNS